MKITFFSDCSTRYTDTFVFKFPVNILDFQGFILSAACSPASNINTEFAASVTQYCYILQRYDSRNLAEQVFTPLYLY